ncbi:unnamed protein product [Adineta ricciae]|uniref:NAD(P)(+)--arginine ADP-ribosyltransferase n=1 Tax=Adineta ricciae TaxID=249248 RepID=A0A815UCF5_ADIRI|nr:unnamed protein product [Adineta ricciae]CAF1593543.1 unnamed protein product [Adineta ricciae]
MKRSSKDIHYYEAFSMAPPSFITNLTTVQPASEFHAKSSDDKDENLYQSTSDDAPSSEILTNVNVHRIFDLFTLIWYDSLVNENKEEVEQVQDKLREFISYLMKFTNIDQCNQYIQENTNEKIILILSNPSNSELLLRIHQYEHLQAIYIYSNNQTKVEEWSLKYNKIIAVVTTYMDLISIIKKDQPIRKRIEQQSISTNFYKKDQFFNDEHTHINLSIENSQFVWTQIYVEILLRIDPSDLVRSFHETNDLCRQYYQDNPTQLQEINEFKSSYTRKQAIKCYTQWTFLYEPLNKALRQNDLSTLFIYRFFLYDLNKNLERLQRNLNESIIHVYRGQILRDDELEMMKKYQGYIISINSIFSTSRDRDVAMMFAQSSMSNRDHRYQPVIFEIEANTRFDSDESRPFADISNDSQFKVEAEVLFMAGCVFRLVNVRFCEKEQCWFIQLQLCSQHDHQLNDFFNWLRNSICSQSNLDSVFYVLRDMGRLNEAEQLYREQLRYTNSNNQFFTLVHLGQIAHAKHEHKQALHLYDQAMQHLDKQIETSTIGALYNFIGEVHIENEDFLLASYTFKQALKYLRHSVGNDHLDTARTYEDLGKVNYAQHNYALALKTLKKCLNIRQKFLPVFHPNLAKTHFLLGQTYERLNEFSMAMNHYKSTLSIQEKHLSPTDTNYLQTIQAINAISKVNM